MKQYSINWSRCIYIDSGFDEDLISRLIPQIATLRNESSDPITVAINSLGGSVYLLDSIRSLITSANQDGHTCLMITVVTHKAFSAAAMFTAMGDYAIALPHSQILFHDVRFGSVQDVTPTSALEAAETLEISNDLASQNIAEYMLTRWTWMGLDTRDKFSDLRKNSQQLRKK